MRRFLTLQLAATVFLAVLAAGASAQAPAKKDKPPTPREAFFKAAPGAVERARTWLTGQQRGDGYFTDNSEENAMIGLALVESGLPAKSPVMQKFLAHLVQDSQSRTNFLAMRVEILVRLLPQMAATARRPIEAVIEKDVAALLAAQEDSGIWQWQARRGGPNLDDSYYAFLTMVLLADRGFKVPDTSLKKAVAMYINFQNANGGWSWSTRGKDIDGSDGQMTLRNVTCLVAFGLDSCACREGPTKVDEAIAASVRAGLKHLGDMFKDWAKGTDDRDEWFYRQNFFLGRLAHFMPVDSVGNGRVIEDWCLPVLGRQEKDGSWKSVRDGQPRYLMETAWVLYLLAQVSRPAILTEMADSDQPPVGNRALLSFTEDLSVRGPVLWRYDRARLGLDLARYRNVPFIYLEITDKFKLAEDEKKNLRDYVTGGGTILAQIRCGKKEAQDAAVRELATVWPACPAQPLFRNHAVWMAEATITNRPPILGLDDGVRTFAFLFQKNLVCDLAGGDTTVNQPSFQLLRNVMAYALEGQMDLAPLPAAPEAATVPQPGDGKIVSLGLLEAEAARKADGAAPPPLPYNPFPTVAGLIAKGANFRLLGPKALGCADEHLALCDLTYLPVSATTTLGEPEVAAMKKYLAGGGFLFLEARLGDEAVDRTVAKKITDALGLKVESAKGSPLLSGTFEQGGQGYAVERTSVRKGGKLALAADTDLRLLTLDGALVGVYSPYDLVVSASGIRCWGLRGYSPTEARRLLTNILICRTVKK